MAFYCAGVVFYVDKYFTTGGIGFVRKAFVYRNTTENIS